MLFQLIARLDQKLNFDTVSAHGEAGGKNDLLLQDGQEQASPYPSWLEDSLNLTENTCDGGIF